MYQPPGVVDWRLGWPWCALVAYRPRTGPGAAVELRAGRGLFWAIMALLGSLTATAMATRPTGTPAEAARGLGVVWGRVS